MQCHYFDAGRCRSCTLMGVPYEAQLADKQEQVLAAVRAVAPDVRPLEPVASAESGFRNKAKLAVGGRAGRPTLGVLDPHGRGVDLQACGLYEPGITAVLPVLHELVAAAGVPPYDVPRRRGELKHVIVTRSPDGELMVRFVLRSPAEIDVLAHNLPELQRRAPAVRVVSVNLLPEHKAVLEGDEEIVLTRQDSLPVRVNGLTLHLRPRSFFQTNTAVAAALYRQARDWGGSAATRSVLDLYCGVGGFALHLAGPGRHVVGVETSREAVRSAERSSAEAGLDAAFRAADATAWTIGADVDTVVVNPPRRGIGPELAASIESAAPRTVLYSSCNVESLARDLRALPTYRAVQARLFDMFPQTTHHEVMVLLERR